jgi:uncharacterized protein (DUF2147 family)
MRRGVRCGVIFVITAALWSFGPGVLAQAPSPVGRWKTVDDQTGDVTSVVEIALVNGALVGHVARVMSPPGDSENPMCDKCPGERKDKPIVGMQIMWDMRADGDEFTGGRILDPDNGKIYRCKVKVIDGGRRLEVRGYIGFSLFGRTQTWVRE